jgi:hypothetical protein
MSLCWWKKTQLSFRQEILKSSPGNQGVNNTTSEVLKECLLSISSRFSSFGIHTRWRRIHFIHEFGNGRVPFSGVPAARTVTLDPGVDSAYAATIIENVVNGSITDVGSQT